MSLVKFWGGVDILETRKCIKCGEDKPLDAYEIRNNMGNGGKERRNDCKVCRHAANKYVTQLKKQYPFPDKNYICPICERDEEALKHLFRGRRAWVLDHDHVTKKFRGWICNQCNTGLSRFNDNPTVLRNAANYIETIFPDNSVGRVDDC